MGAGERAKREVSGCVGKGICVGGAVDRREREEGGVCGVRWIGERGRFVYVRVLGELGELLEGS